MYSLLCVNAAILPKATSQLHTQLWSWWGLHLYRIAVFMCLLIQLFPVLQICFTMILWFPNRKNCLKLLKYLLEQLKAKHENKNLFNKFCSYHVKTAFLHVCSKQSKDEEWLLANLDECFNRLLDYFLDCLREASLPHFFIPSYNFFCNEKIQRTKCYALARAIEMERNNNFPIFSL